MARLLVIQHLEREGLGLFRQVAFEFGIEVLITRVDLGQPLPKPSKGDILLIMGGPMGIEDIHSDQYPWLLEEVNLIRYAVKNQIGIIGVCLGAQLISYANGGSVELLLDRKTLTPKAEIGWKTVHLVNSSSGNNPLDNLFKSPLYVLHWHADRIILPKEAHLIASSNCCEEQLFKIGEYAYGVQFHLEIEDSMIIKWIEEDEQFLFKNLGKNAKEEIMSQQKKYAKISLKDRLLVLSKLIEIVAG